MYLGTRWAVEFFGCLRQRELDCGDCLRRAGNSPKYVFYRQLTQLIEEQYL